MCHKMYHKINPNFPMNRPPAPTQTTPCCLTPSASLPLPCHAHRKQSRDRVFLATPHAHPHHSLVPLTVRICPALPLPHKSYRARQRCGWTSSTHQHAQRNAVFDATVRRPSAIHLQTNCPRHESRQSTTTVPEVGRRQSIAPGTHVGGPLPTTRDTDRRDRMAARRR